MNETIKLYSIRYTDVRAYVFAVLFITGNIVLPQIAHLIPQGGFIFLPIYFFTLIGAYKYGAYVGLLTAVFSPLVNHVLFGMPQLAVLPAILIKSVLLALIAGYCAHRFKRVSMLILLLVVLSYQLVGLCFEWALMKDFVLAAQDFYIGLPGMILQIVGGYFLIKHLNYR